MAATRIPAGDKARKTYYETTDKSILANQARQTVNSEVNLDFVLPVHLASSSAVRDVFQQDAPKGSLPTRHSTVSFLGDARAGVTGNVTIKTTQNLCSSYRRGLQLQVVMGPIGFVYGIGICWLFGWGMVLPLTWKDAYYMVPNLVAALLILQVERQRAYWAFQELGNYPSLLVGRSAKALKKVKDLPPKFTLIDFAGDTVYHCTHHLFLSNLSIHLIVFNMERLEREPDYIRRICYWVQSVIVHVHNTTPHIFIVGTHTNSLPGDRSNFLSQKVSKALLSNEKFTQLIVGKPGSQNNVVFCVENSTPLRKDKQALLLRKTIMEVASLSFQAKKHVPIKWLKVSDFVSKYKSSSNSTDTCLMDKRTLFEKLRQEGVVEAEDEAEELEEMLKFYDEIGEIKVMDDVVVLNLKALVQLVIELVELDCNDHELGIVHVSSLRRVWKYLKAESFLSTIALFERYDILCPISQEQYLVPLLVETMAIEDKQEAEETDHGASAFWDSADSDAIFYFKFYKFYPEAIFLRLLARCLSISQKTHDLGCGADRDIYRNMGRFYQGHDFYYKVELVCQSVDQNMIQVTVKCAPGRGPHSLLSRLHKDLQQIRDRDFPYLNYTVGLPCPACGSCKHDGERDRPSPHILRIAGHDEKLPLPGEKSTLMCRGKAFEVDLGKQHLSILLDPPAPIFGNNWRALADELGLCFQDICYIETKYNPTEMVLEMKSILASQTWQTVNSELNLDFRFPDQLAGSSTARDVFQQDATEGSLPARHSTVSFLGDARAGKTSLEKHLLEKSFDPAEEPTKGLEFDLVQTDVVEVLEDWHTVPEGPYSRYNTGRAQYVALQILKETETLLNPRLIPIPTVIALLCYALSIAVILMVSGSVGFQLGFGVPVLLSVAIFKLFGQTYQIAKFIVGKPGSKNDVVFCVENSIPLRKDVQARLLRKTIMDLASSSFQSKRQVPIKWLKVSDVVSKYKSSSTDTCLLDKRTLFDKLRQEGVVEAEGKAEEFEEILKFYDEIGEIKVMDDVVVLNLKALVQLTIELVELKYDDHELGIVHVKSLRRVWKFLTAENFLSTIALFERYDILCPISQEQYLVPLLLETNDDQVDHNTFWDTAESDTILYFKFYRFYPEAIFLRLLARCLSISQKTHDLGRDADRDVYRTVGRFYQGHDFYYKIELVCETLEQNMIRVTVKCAPDRGPHSLLSRLHKDLQQIRNRDFPYLNYTVGLPCPVCIFNNEGETDRPTPHILRIAGHDEDLPLPGEKVTLMCRGKAFEIDLGKQHLSILLDPPAPIFGNNWRGLADELGLCFQDICYIETKHNPTEMVLEMYSKNTPTANRDQIHRALLDIDRPDAADLFRPTCVESLETMK
uniref:Death domain-containing protein n=1 Tax=Branchiostoma floridae TaxID=7739 RepID=C3YCK0_BRAFL|eukprot:XP_002606027.1 hypothetical protein BRAFLDRAFT_100935 [Branchiostoma floridae]